MRNLAFAVISILIGLLVPLSLAEIILCFLPVREELRPVAVNEANPVFHFTPNQEAIWSQGWRFESANRVRVNNAGYVNDQDYNVDERPLMAVIGDSYVEARMVPYAQTLHGRLAAIAEESSLRVYSFAASGASLSQYLVWAREARIRWKAQALVVVVVGNDFDESLSVGPGFHHYDGRLTLQRADYSPSIVRRALQWSALIRYIRLNLQLGRLLPGRQQSYAGNIAADVDLDRINRSKAVVRTFLADMINYAGWRPDEVIFVLDGIRYPALAGLLAGSFFGKMRSYFAEQAKHAGFEVIDIDQHFFARFESAPVQYEVPNDGHWNGVAHGIAAEAVAASATYRRWRSSNRSRAGRGSSGVRLDDCATQRNLEVLGGLGHGALLSDVCSFYQTSAVSPSGRCLVETDRRPKAARLACCAL